MMLQREDLLIYLSDDGEVILHDFLMFHLCPTR